MRILSCMIGVFCITACTPRHSSDLYQNPVLDRDLPDPAVFRDKDEWIDAYAPQSGKNEVTINIQMARSQNLLEWDISGMFWPGNLNGLTKRNIFGLLI